LIYCFAKLTFA
jgi:hypothetical protein